jgi:acetylglutamate kinase
MRYVVKLGGAGLEIPALLEGCTRAIVELVRDGNQAAVVHGGGVQLTQTLKALGKQSEFINGLRVTDAETRDAALMVLAGKVNKKLVASLGSLGQPALGMSGGDGLLFRARKKRTAPDLGFVGEIAASDPRWLDAIWNLNGVPVLCSMALGLRRRCAGFFDRCAGREGCKRRGAPMAEHRSDCGDDEERCDYRRDVAEVERMP